MRRALALALVCILGVVGALAGQAGAAPDRGAAPAPHAPAGFGSGPVTFEPNHGQFDPRVRFFTRTGGVETFLTDDAGATFVVADGRNRDRAAAVKMRLVGGSPGTARPSERLEGVVSYFRGQHPAGWHAGIPTFGRVDVDEVYPGVDLAWHASRTGALEYDFLVAPGSSPAPIALAFDGARAVRVTRTGDLELRTDAGTVTMAKPVVFEADGTPVDAAYDLRGATVGFALGAYDPTQTLVIDPVVLSNLSFSTLLGGAGGEQAREVAVDGAGNVVVTGTTTSPLFPTTPGAFDRSSVSTDGFVAKMNSAGSALLYSSFLGGSAAEEALGLALDAAGNAVITGHTSSSDLPTTAGAFDSTHNGSSDAFVAKLDRTGTALVFSTYLGGSSLDTGRAVALDAAARVAVTGETFDAATDYPTTAGSFDTTHNGGHDAFLTVLAADGASLGYSTFLGGNAADRGRSVAVDSAGRVVVGGFTEGGTSSVFPTTPGAFRPTPAGSNDAFVTKLDTAGASLVASTLFGGDGSDQAQDIALDGTDAVYVSGSTTGGTFPATAFDTTFDGGGTDAFVVKLAASLQSLGYSTFLGGTGIDGDFGTNIAVDAAGAAHVVGNTTSGGFPTANAFDASHNGNDDLFVTKFSPSGSTLRTSTFLGSSSGERAGGVAIDAVGNVYVAGGAGDGPTPFPTTAAAVQTEHNGGSLDAFVAKLGDFSIAGRVVDEDGAPVAAMPVTLGGALDGTTTTDAQGWFAFLDTLQGATFTVAPHDNRAVPQYHSITALNDNYRASFVVDFQAPFGDPGGVDGSKP